MNVYRQLAADYSELARQYCVTVQYLRRAVCNKDFGRRTRRRAIKLLRHEMQRVIATTEQVELHLSQALEVETNVSHLEDAYLQEIRIRDPFYAKGEM